MEIFGLAGSEDDLSHKIRPTRLEQVVTTERFLELRARIPLVERSDIGPRASPVLEPPFSVRLIHGPMGSGKELTATQGF